MALEYEDLLGQPYKLHGRLPEGLDCSTLWEEVQRRLGADPPATNPYRLLASSGEQGEFEDYLEEMASRFQALGTRLEDARHAGDMILTTGGSCGAGRGLLTLADPALGLFLSCYPRGGVVALTRDKVARAYASSILGVYRFLI